MTSPTPIPGPVSPLATERLAVDPSASTGCRSPADSGATGNALNRSVTTPHALGWLERDGSVDNLRRLDGAEDTADRTGACGSATPTSTRCSRASAGTSVGSPRRSSTTAVSDLAKVLRAAQDSDGYLNSHVQAGLDARWDNLVMEPRVLLHRPPDPGRHRAPAQHRLGPSCSTIAQRAADCVVRDFGEYRRKDTDGHPVIEMALVELYRETGEPAYLDLAQQLIDVRGHGVLNPKGHFDSLYYQDATPVRDETDRGRTRGTRALPALRGGRPLPGDRRAGAAGQRAAAVGLARRDQAYLTGAVGSRFEGESFGDEYELPPDLVYGETCATIAGVMVRGGFCSPPVRHVRRRHRAGAAQPDRRLHIGGPGRVLLQQPRPAPGPPAGRAHRHPAGPGRGARHPAALVPVRLLPAQHHADRGLARRLCGHPHRRRAPGAPVPAGDHLGGGRRRAGDRGDDHPLPGRRRRAAARRRGGRRGRGRCPCGHRPGAAAVGERQRRAGRRGGGRPRIPRCSPACGSPATWSTCRCRCRCG